MTESPGPTVLDASALLALLNDEPGAEAVAGRLAEAVISTVNLAEVVTKLREAGMPADETEEVLTELGLPAIPFDEEQAYVVASLRAPTRASGLSLGDRACLALALTLDRPAVTTDRAWRRLKVGVPVVVAR